MKIIRSGDHPRKAFGARLRSRRERACITLQRLAEATNLSASTFAALEDGDISRWPHGLYRRAFFRQYAEAIGLPDDEAAEFDRVFVDPPPQPTEAAAPVATSDPRLVMLVRRAWSSAVEWLTRKLSTA